MHQWLKQWVSQLLYFLLLNIFNNKENREGINVEQYKLDIEDGLEYFVFYIKYKKDQMIQNPNTGCLK